MKRLLLLTDDDFLKFVDSDFKSNGKVHLRLQLWQDGDGFADVCNDDGGIKAEQFSLFSERNRDYVFADKADLLDFAERLIKMKSFSSENEIFRLGFEICIQCNSDYFVICPALNKGYYAKLNLFNRLIGFSDYREPWENEKFGYWQALK